MNSGLRMSHLNRDRVIVIGGGIAGLATALNLAPMPVTLLAKARLGAEAATPWAQGGIAAAVGRDDEPGLHAADTVAAGVGLCDPAIVKRVTESALACIINLLGCGIAFDRDPSGAAVGGTNEIVAAESGTAGIGGRGPRQIRGAIGGVGAGDRRRRYPRRSGVHRQGR